MRRLTWSVLGIVAFTLAGTVLATGARADRAQLDRGADGRSFDRFVADTLQAYGVPGAVVAVVDDDDVIFLEGFGVRAAGRPESVDPDTRFQLASVSKFLTAASIGTLVDAKIVDWDAPLVSYRPDLAFHDPYVTRHASLRDLLAHRSGLPPYTGDLLTVLGYGTEEILHRLRFVEPKLSLREAYAYSNYGNFVAGAVASHAAGTTHAQLMVDRLFAPVGMNRSGPVLATLTEDANHSAAHAVDGSIMPNENVDAFDGAGAFVSTGADMARWMRMMLAGGSIDGREVLKPATITEIFRASMVQGTGGPLHDPNDSAGLGCESYRFLLDRVIEKNGALDGVRTIVTLVPEKRIGIVVLANRQLTVFPEAVRAEFLERYLGPSGRDLQAQIRGEQAAWESLGEAPVRPSAAEPLKRDLSAFAGRYESRLYGEATVAVNGDAGLRLTIGPAALEGRLGHWSGDTFLLTFDDPDLSPGLLTFSFDADGKVTGVDGAGVPRTLTIDYGHFDRL